MNDSSGGRYSENSSHHRSSRSMYGLGHPEIGMIGIGRGQRLGQVGPDVEQLVLDGAQHRRDLVGQVVGGQGHADRRSWPRRRPRTPRPADRSCWSRTCPPAGSARRPRCAYRCESAEPRSHPNEGCDTPGHRVRPAAGSAVAQLTGDASPTPSGDVRGPRHGAGGRLRDRSAHPVGFRCGAAGEHVERVGDRGCVAGRRGRLRVRGHRGGRPAGQPAAHHRRADHGLGEVRAGR